MLTPTAADSPLRTSVTATTPSRLSGSWKVKPSATPDQSTPVLNTTYPKHSTMPQTMYFRSRS